MCRQALREILTCLSLAALGGMSSDGHCEELPGFTWPAGSTNEYTVGEYAPNEFDSPVFAASDWKSKGLDEPKYDTQWVLVDGLYVLINIPNDMILRVVKP